jgi:hypothetical protein
VSNVNAVAVATEGLKKILDDAIQLAGSTTVAGATVTSVRPHAIPTTFVGVNVFLHQVVPNTAWRNDDLPSRRADGELMRRPQLALDLHYLLTFAGNDAELEPQRLLGATLTGLHAHPMLTEVDIQDLIDNAAPGSYLRHHNDLATQVDRVRFIISAMSTEELSKLWAMFPQTHYSLCAAVQASVVLMEAPVPVSSHRPVLRRGIYTGMPRPPALTAVAPLLTERTVGGSRASFRFTGTALTGASTRVAFDDATPVAPTTVSATALEVAVPDALRAGVHLVTVRVAHAFSSTGAPRSFELVSNALPVVLAPQIMTPSPLATSVGGLVTIDVEPPLVSGQRVRVIVGPAAIDYAPPITTPPTEQTSFTVALPADVEAGDHPLRVEVDGASSLLVDPDPASGDTVPSPYIQVS